MFTPSPYQERIFKWFADPTGPITINAKAGSGKTTTLVQGMNQMRNGGSRLFAAFNSSIVAELKKKLPQSVQCQTIHSLGLATLKRAFGNGIKWDVENGNVKYRHMSKNLKFGEGDIPAGMDPQIVRDCILSMLNYAQLTLTPLEVPALTEMASRFGVEIPLGIETERIAETVKAFLELGRKQAESGLISFSDMLYMPAMLGLEPPKYSLVAVDEAQDLSKVQMTLLTRAMATGGNFIAVGDPRQAIYMFAGAESDSFDQLTNHFGADVLPLNFCYRCPESVILEAQKIVPDIECPEGTRAGIVATVSNEKFQNMLEPGDMVLCRLTAPLVKLCFELIKRRIPAKVRGRDIGAQIANVVKQIMKRNGDMQAFCRLMYEWQEGQLTVLRDKLGSEDQQQAVNDKVDVLAICYGMFKPHSVEGFCYDVKSLFSDDQSPITLCTVHRAKGLENPRVFIIKPEKLPLVRKGQTSAQRTQEENLKYVAVTRAQEELYFVASDPEENENSIGLNPGIPGIS